jgi:hypothetical protein
MTGARPGGARKAKAAQKTRSGRLRLANGLPAKPTAAGAQRRQPTPQSGIDYLIGFFRDAGIDAELDGDGYLCLNGTQTEPLAALPSPETGQWLNTANEIALGYVCDRFIKAVEDNACFGDDVRASFEQRDKGFVITRGDERLAVLHPAHLHILHRPSIRKNFLTPGVHWQQVADVLRDLEATPDIEVEQKATATANTVAAVAAERGWAATPQRIDRLPDTLAPELIRACLDASRRIRKQRRLAYPRPVILQCDAGELTLRPIVMAMAHLLMPFHLHTGQQQLEGNLMLGRRDPLPLLISRNVANEDAITAWIWALLGFADATCTEAAPTRPQERHLQARQARRSYKASRRRPQPRERRWPIRLQPVGRWRQYSSSFVVGHRRRLNDGQMASAEACELARQVGIKLGPHETWVRWHTRGVPEDIEIRFSWHAPTELALLHTSATNQGEEQFGKCN